MNVQTVAAALLVGLVTGCGGASAPSTTPTHMDRPVHHEHVSGHLTRGEAMQLVCALDRRVLTAVRRHASRRQLQAAVDLGPYNLIQVTDPLTRRVEGDLLSVTLAVGGVGNVREAAQQLARDCR